MISQHSVFIKRLKQCRPFLFLPQKGINQSLYLEYIVPKESVRQNLASVWKS